MRLSRRKFLKGFAAFTAGSTMLGGYAVAEPFRLNVTRYRITPKGWPEGLNLRLAVLADIHACEPWMPAERIHRIVARTNALAPDAVLLLGDYVASGKIAFWGQPVPHREWAGALGGLKAPLGVHAVLGNHDWWENVDLQAEDTAPLPARDALKAAGIPVYENDVLRLEKDGEPFWLGGLGDQWAYWSQRRRRPRRGSDPYAGVDDLPGLLAEVTDDAPLVLMAHEPDIFADTPDRVALTIAGHTHGGQVRLGGFAPLVPSRYGQRYLYGHIVEEERHLVVSGGLGCSGLPIRFGCPPEIVMIEVGNDPATTTSELRQPARIG